MEEVKSGEGERVLWYLVVVMEVVANEEKEGEEVECINKALIRFLFVVCVYCFFRSLFLIYLFCCFCCSVCHVAHIASL